MKEQQYQVDKTRIKFIISIYCQEIGIPKEIEEILSDLIIYETEKWSKSNRWIDVSNIKNIFFFIKPVDNLMKLEDLLINKLFNNVTQFELLNEPKYNNQTIKGGYIAKERRIIILKQNLLQQFKGYEQLSLDKDEVKSYRKVIAHEFLHSLKANFTFGKFETESFMGEDFNSSKYNNRLDFYIKLLSNFKNTNISSDFVDENDLINHNNSTKIQQKDISIGFDYKQRIKSVDYSKIKGRVLIEEILTEESCLKMLDIKNQTYFPLLKSDKTDIKYIPMRNIESSNNIITYFATLIKSLVSEDELFKGSFLDSENFVINFNKKYSTIFDYFDRQNESRSAWQILTTMLYDINTTLSEEKFLKLQLILFYCFQERVHKDLTVDNYDEFKEIYNDIHINNYIINKDLEEVDTISDEYENNIYNMLLNVKQRISEANENSPKTM